MYTQLESVTYHASKQVQLYNHINYRTNYWLNNRYLLILIKVEPTQDPHPIKPQSSNN